MINLSNKVFITGITGLLGQALAQDFLSRGYEVSGMKRKGTVIPEQLNQVKIFEGDITDVNLLLDILNDYKIVVHCAALVSFDSQDKKELFRVNVEGTETLVNTCIETKCQKLIYVSSVAALGRPKEGNIISETNQWEESKYNTNYGYSKFLAETHVWRGFEEGLEGFIVNPSIILGRGDINSSSNKIFQQLFKKNITITHGSLNIVDIRDVVDVIRELDKKEINHERLIINGHKLEMKDLFQLLKEESNKILKIKTVSYPVVLLGWLLENIKSFFTGKRAQLTKETLKVLQADSTYSNLKIRELLTFQPRPLKETIHWCSSFYVEKYDD